MLSTLDIVKWANERIAPLMPGVQTYAIAKTAAKDDKIMPYIDEKYIGIDDTFKAQLYHKQLSVTSNNVLKTGFGDNETSLQNTYGMALIVYFNENKCGFNADQLYTYIQTVITGVLKSEGYKSTRVNVVSAILNDSQVWAQEYGQSPYRLSGSQRLIQINYNIVIVFDKQCISIPNCKN